MRGKRFALFIIMIVIGLAAGLVYGWIINPVKYADTSPNMLRIDYKADYVLMVAEIYHADHNLDQAAQRLALLSSLPTDQVVADAQRTARGLGYGTSDLDQMDALAQALKNAPITPTAGGHP